MNHWLMKTEPETFSFQELKSRPQQTERWDGVRNYQARNFMRDQFRLQDRVFIYHSRTSDPAIVGIAEVVREAYPDPTALDKNSAYFDAKSLQNGVSRWVMVDVKAIGEFLEPLTLSRLRQESKLASMALLRPGQRLSVQPVSWEEWDHICRLSPVQWLN